MKNLSSQPGDFGCSAGFGGDAALSDTWIALIPEDPYFVPIEARRVLALNRFMELAPDADQIEIILSDQVMFFDCGANFERVIISHECFRKHHTRKRLSNCRTRRHRTARLEVGM